MGRNFLPFRQNAGKYSPSPSAGISLLSLSFQGSAFFLSNIYCIYRKNTCFLSVSPQAINYLSPNFFFLFSVAFDMIIRYLLSVTAFYCEKRKWSWMRDRLASRKQNSAFGEEENALTVCHIPFPLVIKPFIHVFLVPEESPALPWPRDKSCTPYSGDHLQFI